MNPLYPAALGIMFFSLVVEPWVYDAHSHDGGASCSEVTAPQPRTR